MKQKKSKFRIIKILFKLGVIAGFFGVIAIAGVFAYYAKDLPSPESIQEIKIPESTKIYDRTGEVLLYEIHGEQKRTIIPLSDVPKYMKEAIVVAEDSHFYSHPGVDFRGMARAALANLRVGGFSQGGSTITQQLIRNVYLTSERKISRKVKEIILSIELELKYSKDEILSFYLNVVPFGSNAYGVEAASKTFFQKGAKDLTLAESATLASLVKGTTYYSPFGNNPEKLKERQKYILNRMFNLGYISEEELNLALNEEIKYTKELHGIKAPHFVMYTREYLEDKYGEDSLKVSGFNVKTTLDWELQLEAERILREWMDKNSRTYSSKNAALTAIDPKTGQILAMVGSRDYFDIENDGNVNVATRPRQPGSSFKPFVYAKAFQKGYTPDTIVFDVETNFGIFGAKEYIPHNYTGKFLGPIKLKEALAQSINVPAVKVLYLAGVKDAIKLAKSFGITTLNEPDRYGLALVLGGGEVTLLDETSAYGVFSQDGIKNQHTAILSVESDGEIIEEFKAKPEQVLEPQIARLINSILSSNELRAPLFGEQSYLNLGKIPAGVKTGTTEEFRDAWTVGYTKDIVVGIWSGNNDNSPTNRGSGSRISAPIWSDFVKKAYEIKKWEITEFEKPEPIETGKPILDGVLEGEKRVKIDAISQKLITQYTPEELVKEVVFYEPHSLLYYVDKENPQGPLPPDPQKDPQFSLWEEGIKKWVQERKNAEGAIANNNPDYIFAPAPQEYDDVHVPENFPKVSVLLPYPGDKISPGQDLNIYFEIKNTFPAQKIEIFLDNTLLNSVTDISIQNRQYSTSIKIPYNITDSTNIHSLKIRVTDSVLNKGEGVLVLVTL